MRSHLAGRLFAAVLPALLLAACTAPVPAPGAAPPAVGPEARSAAEDHVPEILAVEERAESEHGRSILHKDIYFTDRAGDAITVVNDLVGTDPAGMEVAWTDDPITIPAGQQKLGAAVTSTLKCPETLHPVVFIVEDRIRDAAGNLSGPVTVTFACPASDPPNSLPALLIALVFNLGLLAGLALYLHRRAAEREGAVLSLALLFCLLFPVNFIGSILHEGGHALAAWVLRGTVSTIYVHPFTFAGYSRPFTDLAWVHGAGYLANLLVPLVFFCLLWRQRALTNLLFVLLLPYAALSQGLQMLILHGDTANIMRLTALPAVVFVILGLVLVCSGSFFLLALFPLLGLAPGDKKSLLVVPAAFALHSMVSWLIAHGVVPGSAFENKYLGVGVEVIASADLMAVVVPVITALCAVLYLTLFRRVYDRLPGWLQTGTASLTCRDLGFPALLAGLSVMLGLLAIT